MWDDMDDYDRADAKPARGLSVRAILAAVIAVWAIVLGVENVAAGLLGVGMAFEVNELHAVNGFLVAVAGWLALKRSREM